MHIPWALYLITLIIFICGSVFHSAFDVAYADYKNTFTENGTLSTNSNKSSQTTRIRYPSGNIVYGITIFEKLLATALDNTIVVYNISSSVKLEDVHRIQLPMSIREKLLEFKFIEHEMLLYCDALTCRLCVLTSPEKSCMEYLLRLNGKGIEELMYAAAVKDSSKNVNIRIVTKMLVKLADKLVSIQSAEDIRIIDEHSLATAFNRRGYTFFVGSARRPYEPYINAKIEELIVMDVLGLRMNVVSLAAEYDSESDELIVVFQSIEKNENVACKYNMDLDCQKTQNLNELPSYCFIFSRRADGHAVRTCSKFGGNYIKESLDNCDLELFRSFAYRYGWLEQFRAFAGQFIADLPGSGEDILSVKRFHEDGALFTVHSNGFLNRVSDQTHQVASSLLWSLQLQQLHLTEQPRTFQYHIAADLTRSRIYFVQDNEVRDLFGTGLSYTELSCPYFYDTCDSLERSNWSDPLQCLWCAMNNGSGYAFSRSNGNGCPFYTVVNLCVPFIEHVNIPSSSFSNYTSFEVYGRKFDRLEDIVAKVCNQHCAISHFGSAKLSCTVSIPNNVVENCDFHVEGKLGSLGQFGITFKLSKNAIPTLQTSFWQAHAHIQMIVLVFLIVLILCLLRQFHRRQRNRMKQCGTSGSQIALDTSHATFVSSNPFGDLKRKGDEMKAFNPYENLFLEIDSKLQIPLKDLELGDKIGEGNGNFGVVYRAVYRSADGQLVDVACKTVDSQSNSIITGISEFLQEGLIMANFDHPNVARLIGISSTRNNYPIIVTDFMAQGDLRHYIINPENRLTFGNLLDFGIQIAKGMTYLHDKQFIHRDLAARNCMLNAYLVVKIADFGLSRDVSRYGMYEAIHKDRGIPIRWMPIESLEEQQYTFKGDVWAYGIVLWELATRGLIPYADLEFTDILRLLKIGHRLMKPKGCPDNLVRISCDAAVLDGRSKCRPTFFELTEIMEDVVQQLRCGVSGDGVLLDSHYERVSSCPFSAS
ncbi:Hepatocyte growth factor receptor [Dirofilaria immitis]|nr:Hepatocyte growth factor receptor [Dirofilaria immitis]